MGREGLKMAHPARCGCCGIVAVQKLKYINRHPKRPHIAYINIHYSRLQVDDLERSNQIHPPRVAMFLRFPAFAELG